MVCAVWQVLDRLAHAQEKQDNQRSALTQRLEQVCTSPHLVDLHSPVCLISGQPQERHAQPDAECTPTHLTFTNVRNACTDECTFAARERCKSEKVAARGCWSLGILVASNHHNAKQGPYLAAPVWGKSPWAASDGAVLQLHYTPRISCVLMPLTSHEHAIIEWLPMLHRLSLASATSPTPMMSLRNLRQSGCGSVDRAAALCMSQGVPSCLFRISVK